MDSEIIFYALQLGIIIIAFILGKYVFPEMKKTILETDNEFVTLISAWVYKFVVNAKNEFGHTITGEQKKQWVMDNVKLLLAKWNVELTDAQISALIESAYDQMKKNLVELTKKDNE